MTSSEFIKKLELAANPYAFVFWRKDFKKKVKPEQRDLFIILMKLGYSVPTSFASLETFENVTRETALNYCDFQFNYEFINVVIKHSESKTHMINLANKLSA